MNLFMYAEGGITYTAHIVRFHLLFTVIHTAVIHPEVSWQLKAVRGCFCFQGPKRLPDVFDIVPLPGGIASATSYF